MQHYAFLMSEEEFDGAFGRIKAAGVTYYPGLYFLDPAGHGMEIITRPYGSGG